MLKPVYKLITSALQKKNFFLIRGLMFLGRRPAISLNKLDYVRVATLELIAEEIRQQNVQGSTAELGVFQGGFSKYINEVFADRKLFLFDTFAGFENSDIEKEKAAGLTFSGQDFSDTSIEKVLEKMKFPKNCVVRKGLFPGTFEGLEQEHFCFVSIDADLYEPIAKGLEIFYRNLSPGGYIMVHDFNNAEYKGCRKAVVEFCSANQISYVPIPDIGGSVVIRKSEVGSKK